MGAADFPLRGVRHFGYVALQGEQRSLQLVFGNQSVGCEAGAATLAGDGDGPAGRAGFRARRCDLRWSH